MKTVSPPPACRRDTRSVITGTTERECSVTNPFCTSIMTRTAVWLIARILLSAVGFLLCVRAWGGRYPPGAMGMVVFPVFGARLRYGLVVRTTSRSGCVRSRAGHRWGPREPRPEGGVRTWPARPPRGVFGGRLGCAAGWVSRTLCHPVVRRSPSGVHLEGHTARSAPASPCPTTWCVVWTTVLGSGTWRGGHSVRLRMFAPVWGRPGRPRGSLADNGDGGPATADARVRGYVSGAGSRGGPVTAGRRRTERDRPLTRRFLVRGRSPVVVESAPGATRTHTGRILSPLPLPIGLRGRSP